MCYSASCVLLLTYPCGLCTHDACGQTLVGIYTNPHDNSSKKTQPPYAEPVPIFDLSGLAVAVSAITFAQMAMQGVPDIMAPLHPKVC